ncbi:dihydrofolate reductase family protein [Bdellovibrio sp. HCB2-146]|uniref:dihydrofolate reductase family protein n=1 Tax=Bdellovibrio sp. HCB2-146 TaxID=3394362 RepID=UPI0039BD7E54
MRTIFYSATSLNGFIADENNSLDWLFQFGGEGAHDFDSFIKDVGAIAMGATTYQWVYDNAIAKNPERLEPWPYAQPSWVFTHHKLPHIPDADVKFVQGDVKPIHDEMVKVANGKNIWVVGGGELVGKFYDQGLLDELILQVAPLTLVGGAPLLPRRIHPPMKLLGVSTKAAPFVELHYEIPKA